MSNSTNAMAILTNAGQFGKFNILNHLEKLEIIKETHSFIEILCPICQAENFKIHPQTGQYDSYSCDCMKDEQLRKEIVKLIAPFPRQDPRPLNKRPILASKFSQPNPETEQLPEISDKVTLAQHETIPGDRPQRIAHGTTKQITYRYSATQGVDRIETPNPEKPKGYDKTFRQWHLDKAGKRINTKGEETWPLYREAEIITAQSWPLLVEGEECVESLREIGIAATTFQGSNWSKPVMVEVFSRLKSAGIPGLIMVPDNDDTGEIKSNNVLIASVEAEFPVIIVDITALWPEAPEKGDIADWITWGKTNEMYSLDYIRRLEAEIHRAVNERQRERQRQKTKPNKHSSQQKLTADQKYERFIAELKLIEQEQNTAKRLYLLQDLAIKESRPLSQIRSILTSLGEESVTPQKTEIDVHQLFSMGTKSQNWLIPGHLPQGELVILAAQPKVGKTLLATDLILATVTGGYFMGEKIEKGKVLYVTSDESLQSISRRFKAAGFGLLSKEEKEDICILTSFDIASQGYLQTKLNEFKPSLVIFDSLTSISRRSGVSENDAEFSRPIYQLRDLLASTNTSGILIHHNNKSKEARGIEKMSGSLRIAAAAWGIWQLSPDSQDASLRKLTIVPRETEASSHFLAINNRAEWIEKGIYSYLGEVGDEVGEKRTAGQKIIEILKNVGEHRLEALEIKNLMGGYSNIYTILGRLEDRGLIHSDISPQTRKTVYWVEQCTSNTEPENIATPPPWETQTENKSKNPETIEIKDFDDNNVLLTVPVTSPTNTFTNTPNFSGGGEGVTASTNETVLTENKEPADQDDLEPLDWNDVIEEMDACIKQLGWTTEQARKYVQATYGKKSRLKLTDKELLELLGYFRNRVQEKE